MGKKRTIEEVREIINKFGYELVTEYINGNKKNILKDIDGYFYFKSVDNIIKNKTKSRFDKSNPYTIQNIKLWCKLNNKPFELLSEIYEGSSKKLKWQCLKERCGEIFSMNWKDIYYNHGCSFCNGMQVGATNCLATKNPELIKEWHPTKNGKLTPWTVTASSGKLAWWICSINSKHEWSTLINARSKIHGNDCPYCCPTNCLPSEDYNLLVINPELCEEWNYDKNVKNPEEYTPASGAKVWWRCKECNYEWKIQINNRKKGTGCPECNKSKGEKECKRVFDLRNIDYIPQKEFEGLIGLGGGLLSYDFYLPKYNILLEYQGIQHEKYVKGFHNSRDDFKKQQEHDRRKKEYALANGYNFLEIWYYDFDKIENILNKKLIEINNK